MLLRHNLEMNVYFFWIHVTELPYLESYFQQLQFIQLVNLFKE